MGQKESEKSKASASLKPLEGTALEEFRQSLKKVEFPSLYLSTTALPITLFLGS